MRTTVDLDTHLLKQLRAEARRRGVSLKDLLHGLLRRRLGERASTARTRYRCPTFEMGVPDRTIRLDKALALAAALENDQIARELALRK